MEDDKTNYDDCPAKYLQRLKAMLNYTGSRGLTNLITQCQTPEEWLEALTKVDFADPVSVLKLRSDLGIHNATFILCTGKDTFTISARSAHLTVEETPVVDGDSSLRQGLKTLEFFRESKARPAPADEKAPESSPVRQPLPSVVMLIGRLHKGHTTESGIENLDKTHYVVVVDAIAPEHPVWLIWDRLASNEHGTFYIHPDDLDPVFEGVGKNFDAAQILPSINDWFASYGNLDFNQLEESINATRLVGSVKAKEATLMYVTELLGLAQSQLATDTMENNEMSDARFAEINAAVGSHFEVSPSVYLQKLEEATARDNSLDQYLHKSLKVNKTPGRPSLEWLQKLAIADFADINAVWEFDLGFYFHSIGLLDLATIDETTYSIVPDSCALPHDEPTTYDFHDLFLSLKTSALPGTGKSLPTLVYTVGVVVKVKKGSTYDPHSDKTQYVLVVDAVAPGHPVWLVYNRESWYDFHEEQHIVDPADEPLIFKNIGHNFDAAQIFPSVHDWIQSYGNVDFAKCEESIKATCITGAVEAKAILSSEVEVLLHQ